MYLQLLMIRRRPGGRVERNLYKMGKKPAASAKGGKEKALTPAQLKKAALKAEV